MIRLPARGLAAMALAAWIVTGVFAGAAAQRRDGAPAPIEGFYVGAFAGAIIVDSKVTIRGNGTQANARLRDTGAVLGLRGGWGMRLTPGLYVGLELEGMVAHRRGRCGFAGGLCGARQLYHPTDI